MNNLEKILNALTRVPLASTQQLAALNDSLDRRKKASRLLRELEQGGLLTANWHGKERVWRLSKKGRQTMKITRTKSVKNLTHTLAVGQIYFDLQPSHFLFEPAHKFIHLGKQLVWEPDCIYVHDKKVWCCEVQLTPISRKRWEKKWGVYSTYFNKGYYEQAQFQAWGSKIIRPRFVVITQQSKEVVMSGFNITGRELLVRV